MVNVWKPQTGNRLFKKPSGIAMIDTRGASIFMPAHLNLLNFVNLLEPAEPRSRAIKGRNAFPYFLQMIQFRPSVTKYIDALALQHIRIDLRRGHLLLFTQMEQFFPKGESSIELPPYCVPFTRPHSFTAQKNI